MIGIQKNFSTPALTCTKQLFEEVTNSENVKVLCDRIASVVKRMDETAEEVRRKELREEYKALKVQLPAFMFQGISIDGKHLASSCFPTGYTMLDADDVDDPIALWKRIEPLKEECHIRLAHITPSTRGLRLVVDTLPGKSIRETQALMAERLGIPAENHDDKVYNLNRISFAVPSNYLLWLDETLFDELPPEEQVVTIPVEQPADLFPDTLPAKSVTSAPLPFIYKEDKENTYQGIPFSKIAQRLLPRIGYETGPEEGQRHNAFIRLLFYWRYLLGDDLQRVKAALPFSGLPESELDSMVRDAFRQKLYVNMPRVLRETIDECLDEKQALADMEKELAAKPLPTRLPRILSLITRSVPKEYEEQCALAVLPMLGTLGTGIRANWLDGREHTPSLMATIVGPSASGKSFIIPVNQWLLKPLYDLDHEADEIERRYDEECNETPANKQKPKRPHVHRRIVAERSSETMIKERMLEAQGQHVYCFTAEIDTVTKGKRRPTDDISTIHRMAFDNEEVRQDYKTTGSFRGSVKCMYNSLYTGTPEAVDAYYSNTENGTVQRIIFIDMPYTIGQRMPKPRTLSNAEKAEVEQAMQKLMTLQGTVNHKRLLKMFSQWLEHYRLIALKSQDASLDCFYKRAAVIGFRAGMIAVALEGNKETKAALEYARWVAEYVLASLMKRFGEKVNEQISSLNNRTGLSLASLSDLYGELPNEFTSEEALSVRQRHNLSAGGTRMMISRWREDGLIIDIAHGRYRKATKQSA